MRFDQPLIPGTLQRRYKRFLSDVELADGTVVTAHCPNPGAMTGLAAPGIPVWLSKSPNPKRKLPYTWELLRLDDTYVGINTQRPNALAEEAIRAGRIAELAGYTDIRREVKYGENSRIDLLLSEPGRPDCYVEIKNVHLRRNGPAAEFPDSVTKRGAKHMAEMATQVAVGHRAVVLFVVQRTDCDHFALAADIDPGYAAAFDAARTAGVEALCCRCDLSPQGIEIKESLPIYRN